MSKQFFALPNAKTIIYDALSHHCEIESGCEESIEAPRNHDESRKSIDSRTSRRKMKCARWCVAHDTPLDGGRRQQMQSLYSGCLSCSCVLFWRAGLRGNISMNQVSAQRTKQNFRPSPIGPKLLDWVEGPIRYPKLTFVWNFDLPPLGREL